MHKGKGMQHPQPILSDVQAREKLNIYVYEYLTHLNFQQTAKMFLNELNWNKQNVQVGEAPGFLLSWWNVFWDLYLAATPDRRDQYEPSNDAKMFHDYTNNMNPQMVPPAPPQEMAGAPSPMMTPNNQFFGPPGGQPNPMMNSGQQFQRFPPGQRGGMRMDFNPNPNNQMPPGRAGAGGPPNQQPQGPPPNQPPHMGFNGAQRPQPSSQQPPQPPGTPVGGPMSPMSMQQPQRWNPSGAQAPQTPGPGPMQQMPPNMAPPSHNMGYASTPSPLSAYGGNNVQGGMPPMGVQPGAGGPPGPGTPGLMSSPPDGSGQQVNQGPPNDLNFNNMMKSGGGGGPGMQFGQDPNMGHMVQMNPDMGGPPQHHPHLANEMMDSIKNSPIQNMQVNRHPDEHVGGSGPGPGAGGPDLNSFGQYGDPGVNLF